MSHEIDMIIDKVIGKFIYIYILYFISVFNILKISII